MGYLKSIGTSVIYIGTFFAAITFIPGLPPVANFTEYSINYPKELSGDLALNERLNGAELLFEGQLKGPEAFASYNGELYTGVHGGYVVKVTKDKLIPVVKFGKDCDGHWQEAKCGRPLGMKFDKSGSLYVADGYYGIFKVDVKTGKYERLVDIKKPIEGKAPMIINSLDVASNGDIYWSDSSTEFTIEDGTFAMMADPSGRLIRYNAATKKNEVLVHDLGFANGVALSKDEQFVIVSETLTSRIIKYYIKGPQANKKEVFIDALPGHPDNIHSDNENGFLVSLVVYVDSENPQLSQSLMPHPLIRRMAARFLALLELPFKFWSSYYPNYYAEKIVNYIGHFESMMFLTPKINAVLRIDQNGKIIDAAYITDSKVAGISSAYIHDSYLWLGSPFTEFIARVPLKQAFPSLAAVQNDKLKKEEPSKQTAQKKDSEVPPKKASEVPPKKASEVPPKKASEVPPKKASEVPPKKDSQVPPKASDDKSQKKQHKST